MKKILALFTIAFLSLFAIPVFAQQTINESESFSVQIPPVMKVEGVGMADASISHGLPSNNAFKYTLLVDNSYNGEDWELTTNVPVGVSVSYNVDGTLVAAFVSMRRANDNFTIPQSDIRIYPSKVVFQTQYENGRGDSHRIFHFYPIIRVSKNTPPGFYVGEITFTLAGTDNWEH